MQMNSAITMTHAFRDGKVIVASRVRDGASRNRLPG